MITMGPRIPATKPPYLKSFCSKKPELKAMALGGVEIGKNRAAEALNPMTNGSMMLFDGTRMMAMGIRIVAVAVLLIKFEKTMVMTEKAAISA